MLTEDWTAGVGEANRMAFRNAVWSMYFRWVGAYKIAECFEERWSVSTVGMIF